MTLRVLVAGAGVIGTHHVGILAGGAVPGVELVGVIDHTAGAAKDLAAPHDLPAFTNLEQAVRETSADTVVVCTPTGTHMEVALDAMRAGCHVLIEKPADISVERTDILIEEEKRRGVVVGVVSQHRFDPASEQVQRLLDAGEFGTLTSGIASTNWWRGQDYYDSGHWRGTWHLDGGGALTNQGIHAVDLLLSFFGDPVSVTARTALLAHERIDVEDVAVATLEFASGALGLLHATTAAYPGLTVRIALMGSEGSAVIEDDRLSYLHTRRAAQAEDPSSPAANQALLGSASNGDSADQQRTAGSDPSALSEAHSLQWGDFAAAITEGRRPRVTLQENRRSLATIGAVYASAADGGRPVQLPS
ncbi:MAG: Gfo/Idh/MocA family oxidoreductase [Brachybacterium sp.]|nr:Gfo/Idh/MocA family oxidoreductase [Brachybacterium sp.]